MAKLCHISDIGGKKIKLHRNFWKIIYKGLVIRKSELKI